MRGPRDFQRGDRIVVDNRGGSDLGPGTARTVTRNSRTGELTGVWFLPDRFATEPALVIPMLPERCMPLAIVRVADA